MAAPMISRADAKLIAEAVVDCADRAASARLAIEVAHAILQSEREKISPAGDAFKILDAEIATYTQKVFERDGAVPVRHTDDEPRGGQAAQITRSLRADR